MLTVIVGVGSALLFGFADFFGGLAAKRMSAIRVTAIAAATGLVALCVALPVLGGVWSWQAVVFGGLSGVAGAIAIVLLYACLAIGPMSILSPVTAVVSAIVPVIVGVARGDRLTGLGYVALGIALVAVVLVGLVKEERAVRPSAKALLMAVGSGSMIGLFLILIDLTPDDSGLVPLIANRAVNGALMFLVIGVLALWAVRRSARVGGVVLPGGQAVATDAGGRAQPSSSTRQLSAVPDAQDGRRRWRRSEDQKWSSPQAPARSWRAGLAFALVCGVIDAVANSILLWGLR
ncbi:MAG TPA: EamA/RhaT family transporter, partial [Terrimesophilobacter sp.]|nr:EamA/RhaT family transporter [Terrimesophilobacter sp.]